MRGRKMKEKTIKRKAFVRHDGNALRREKRIHVGQKYAGGSRCYIGRLYVEHDGMDDEGEQCTFCDESTHWWTVKGDFPVCYGCAKIVAIGDFPPDKLEYVKHHERGDAVREIFRGTQYVE